MESSLLLSGDVLRRWQQIGTVKDLATDSDIASFLLMFYETAAVKEGLLCCYKLCAMCSTPLSLVCLTCHPELTGYDTKMSPAVLMTSEGTGRTRPHSICKEDFTGQRSVEEIFLIDNSNPVPTIAPSCQNNFAVNQNVTCKKVAHKTLTVRLQDVVKSNCHLHSLQDVVKSNYHLHSAEKDKGKCVSKTLDSGAAVRCSMEGAATKTRTRGKIKRRSLGKKEHVTVTMNSGAEECKETDEQNVQNTNRTQNNRIQIRSRGKKKKNGITVKKDRVIKCDNRITTNENNLITKGVSEIKQGTTFLGTSSKALSAKHETVHKNSNDDIETYLTNAYHCENYNLKMNNSEICGLDITEDKRTVKSHKFPVCLQQFAEHLDLRDDVSAPASSKKRYCCTYCSASFLYHSSLIGHERKHTGIRPYICQYCNKAFARLATLKQHSYVHTKETPYKCDICGESFRQRGLRLVHIRKVHTRERPFSCNICSASFYLKGHMENHMTSHSDYRPFLCDECGASFKNKGAVKEHKLIHKGIRNFACDICKKTFYKETHVRCHKRTTHLGVREKVCSLCGAAFFSKSTLQRHMLRHTQVRPHQCQVCCKAFASGSELKVHFRIHSGVRPYVCDICSCCFQTMGNMKKHRHNIHKNAPPYVSHKHSDCDQKIINGTSDQKYPNSKLEKSQKTTELVSMLF